MMYRHVIDECLERARNELRIYRGFHQDEYADHVQRRIDSLKRLRERAPVACFTADHYKEANERKSLKEILQEFSTV